MPKYFEKTINAKGKASYLFEKRLNPKHGTFPLFKDKVKCKMAATTDAEATREAKTLVAELDLLQEVARKDGKHVISNKDKNKAAETWVKIFSDIDLPSIQSLKGKHTKAALDAKEDLERTIDEVSTFYKTTELDHEGGYRQWLTDFGDHLIKLLKDGQGVGCISEGVELYLKQTQRDHLDDKATSVRAANRVAEYFIEIIGDKQLDQISRKDVEKYIATRLEKVKTTSVQREMRTLSALWNRCADALDITTRSPFSNQPIRGLGSDSIQRPMPSVVQTIKLLEILESKATLTPTSYVWPLVAIAALTGLRLSETWGLLPEDWDQVDQVLVVRKNAKRSTLKTTNSIRPIPVLPPLENWLKRYFFALSETDGAKSANSASASSLKALKKLNIHFGNHSLRHGFKQRLVEVDAPKSVIDELQGWSSQNMAANYGRNQATETKRRLIWLVYEKLGLFTLKSATSLNVIALRK